jgi:alpha-beta hydrolase superfamily lysophospholipase
MKALLFWTLSRAGVTHQDRRAGRRGVPSYRPRSEADPINFAPRVKIPVLMINGRHDFAEPVDKTQKPMFRWFGAPEKDKRHVLLGTTHYALVARNGFVREVLGWFDEYLGPVP